MAATDTIIGILRDFYTGSISFSTVSYPLPSSFDYISASYPDAITETYDYKSGGSGGTTLATITLVYTDSSKRLLSSWSKT